MALWFAPPAMAAGPAPVVVELFTSQGCNSCSPADALLGELAGRDDVLPLSFHVTYWDRLGWRDSFGPAASTRRQEESWPARLYIPQIVAGGRLDAVGSQPRRVCSHRSRAGLTRVPAAAAPLFVAYGL